MKCRSLLPLIFLAALLLPGFFLPEGFWITDNENKFLLLLAADTSEDVRIDLKWKGAGVVPDHDLDPYPPPFVVSSNGQRHSQYSPLFPILSLPAWRSFGFKGLYLLPVVGTLLLAFALFRDGSGTPRQRWLTVFLAVFCTPLWFYTWTFWEHTLALGLLFLGLTGLAPGRPSTFRNLLQGHAFLLAACCLREEYLLIWGLVLLHQFVIEKQPLTRLLYSAGPVAVLLLGGNAVFLRFTTGTWMGHHASANAASVAEWLGSRAEAFENLWIAAPLPPFAAWGVGLFLTLLLVCPATVSRRFRGPLLPSVATLGLIVGVFALRSHLAAPDVMIHLLLTNGFFCAAPLLWLGLIPPAANAPKTVQLRWQYWRGIALGFGLLYTLIAPAISTQGMHWGGRFLLPVYIALLCAARESWLDSDGTSPTSKPLRLLIPALIALSLGLQLASLHTLALKKSWSADLQRKLRDRPERVWVTETWWLGHAVWGSVGQREIYRIQTQAEAAALMTELSKRGVTEFLRIGKFDVADPDAAVQTHALPGLSFFDVTWQTLRVPGSK